MYIYVGVLSIGKTLFGASMKKNELATEADVVYMIYPEEVARKKLDWPGAEAFYKPVEEEE